MGEESRKRNRGGIIDEESWSNHGGGIMENESRRKCHGGGLFPVRVLITSLGEVFSEFLLLCLHFHLIIRDCYLD